MLETKQTCDRCKTSRTIRSKEHIEDGGWRVVPVDTRYGTNRIEQPMLCAPCCRFLLDVIHEGEG